MYFILFDDCQFSILASNFLSNLSLDKKTAFKYYAALKEKKAFLDPKGHQNKADL